MRNLFFVLILWTVFVFNATAETKIDITYGIKKAWVDEQDLYVLYEKTSSKVFYSKLNIHGSILNEETHLYLKKIGKKELEASQIDLNTSGKLIATEKDNLTLGYYIDSNLVIQEKNGVTTLSSGQQKAEFPCDHIRWGKTLVPIKFGSDIFYCGILFSTSTGSLRRFPPNVQEKFQSMITTTPYYSGTLLTAAEGRFLLVTPYRTTFTETMKPRSAEILKVQIDSMDTEVVRNPSMSSGGYWPLHIEEAYFNDGFALRDDATSTKALLCNTKKCDEVLGTPYYVYLVVDGTSDQDIFMYQHDPTSSVIKINSVRH